MMKIIAILLVLFLLAGCSANDAGDKVIADEKDAVDGYIEDGIRIIELRPGYSVYGINVYRGETVRLIFSEKGMLSISAPAFESAVEGEGEISIEFKTKGTGDYEVTACVNEECETGKLTVKEFVKQGVYASVDAQGFEQAMTGNYVILDVRTQQEYNEGHIDGAILIPHYEVANRLDEIRDYDKVLVYCRSGNRSIPASEILVEAGFAEVYNLQGGIGAWNSYKGS